MKIKPKTLLTLILMVGISGIILGFFQLNKSINDPFKDLAESPLNTSEEREELAVLVDMDTDGDSLSDFDELYIYGTSPYLADSDSDGINDDVELSLGNDPNCPQGKQCVTAPTGSATNSLANQYGINENTNSPSVNVNSVENPSVDEVPLDELRSALQGAGVPAETLDNIDDETLRQMYSDALAKEETNVNLNINVSDENINALPENITYDDLSNLSIDEIRDLLKATGVPADSIDALDDATLKAIFDESLKELAGSE